MRGLLAKILEEAYAFLSGFESGWKQPDKLVWKEELPIHVHEMQDSGITFGQKLKHPLNNESKREGYKLGLRKKKRG
jgi:hypothetical protein